MTLIFKDDLEEEGVQGTLEGGYKRKEDGKVYRYVIPATDDGNYNQIPGTFYNEKGIVGPGVLTNIALSADKNIWFDATRDRWYPFFIPDEPWECVDIVRTLLYCEARVSVILSLIEMLREKHPDLSEEVVNLLWNI